MCSHSLGVWRNLLENLRTSPFNEDLWNDTTLIQKISLDSIFNKIRTKTRTVRFSCMFYNGKHGFKQNNFSLF
jgi:hypothetical protein